MGKVDESGRKLSRAEGAAVFRGEVVHVVMCMVDAGPFQRNFLRMEIRVSRNGLGVLVPQSVDAFLACAFAMAEPSVLFSVTN